MADKGAAAAGTGGVIQKYSDVMIAAAIVTIVLMMIIPLPTMLLDLLLCVNVTLAIVIVMVTIYNQEALDLSVFPSAHHALSTGAERLFHAPDFVGRLCRRGHHRFWQLCCRR